MTHDNAGRIRDQIQLLRRAPRLPSSDLLDPTLVRDALHEEAVRFRDRLYTPMVTLRVFLSQVLSPDHSCREAVSRLIAHLVAGGRRPCSADTASYCEARQRLPTGVRRRLCRGTADALDQQAPPAWSWKGRPVVIIDGTTVSMPDTPADQRAFPQARTQAEGVGFPIARLVAVVSLATGVIRDLAVGPYKGKETGEDSLFRSTWDRLEAGVVVLGDRHFGSYFGIAPLAERGVDGLYRMHQRRKFDFRRGRRLGVGDHVVRWAKPARPDWMDEATHGRLPADLAVREIRVRVEEPGFRVDEVVLATTLLDPAGYPQEDPAELYFERWNIELDLRSIKCPMGMDVLRCKDPEMVEKEVWAHALAYNLVRGLIAAAAQAHGQEPRGLSFKGALQALAAFGDALRLARPGRRDSLIEEMLHTIATHEVGDRPGRVEPRAIERRPKPHKRLNEPRKAARKRLLGRS